MNISDFARQRGLAPQTISIYINRHKELFEGHTSRDKNNVFLDEVALGILEQKYPLPIDVYGVPKEEHEELKKKYEALQIVLATTENNLEKAQSRNERLSEKLEASEEKLKQIEDKSRQTDVLEAENKRLKEELEQFKKEAEEEKASEEDLSEMEIYKMAISKLPNPPRLMDRLFDRKLEHWRMKQAEALTKMTDKEREIVFKYGFIGDGK